MKIVIIVEHISFFTSWICLVSCVKIEEASNFYVQMYLKGFWEFSFFGDHFLILTEFSLMFTSTVRNSIHFYFLYLLFLHYMFRPM
jgi:hypothetical protein